MKLDKVLPNELMFLLAYSQLNEIRLRAGQKIRVLVGGVWHYVGDNCLIHTDENAVVITREQVEQTLSRACERSVYAYSEQIAAGYIAIEDGVRIGIAGTVVRDKNAYSVRDITSLVIRIQRRVVGCCEQIADYVLATPVNTLIISPPLCGKTTLLADICRYLGKRGYNILVADERGELTGAYMGIQQYNLCNCDIVKGASKQYVFEKSLRSLSPDIIVCDELVANDCVYAHDLLRCGITLYASVHSSNVKDAQQRLGNNDLFERYVVLSRRKGLGTIEGVFDKNDNKLV